MSELRPCPFCKGNQLVIEAEIDVIYCNDCSCEGSISDWNSRPREEELEKRIAELEKKIAETVWYDPDDPRLI